MDNNFLTDFQLNRPVDSFSLMECLICSEKYEYKDDILYCSIECKNTSVSMANKITEIDISGLVNVPNLASKSSESEPPKLDTNVSSKIDNSPSITNNNSETLDKKGRAKRKRKIQPDTIYEPKLKKQTKEKKIKLSSNKLPPKIEAPTNIDIEVKKESIPKEPVLMFIFESYGVRHATQNDRDSMKFVNLLENNKKNN